MTPLLTPEEIGITFWLSLRIAGGATLLSLLLGVPLAWLLSRRRLRGRLLWEGITMLPLVMPPTVLGYYLLTLFGARSFCAHTYHMLTGKDLALVFTWQGATLAASIVSLPLLIRTLQPAFASIDPDLLDAARVYGASEVQIVRSLLLPLVRPALIAGMGLAFARALGDFGATLMVGGNIPGQTRTLSLALYDAYNAGDAPLTNSLVLLLSTLCLSFVLFSGIQTKKSV